MDTKRCAKCLKDIPIELFAKESSGYIRNKCNACRLDECRTIRKEKQKAEKIIPVTKKCIECDNIKDAKHFSKLSLSNDGLSNYCKECYRKTRNKKVTELPIEIIDITCIKCLTTKTSSEFISNKKSKTGFYKTCKDCWKPREWNKEKQKASERKYIAANPSKIREKWKKAALNPNRIMRDRLNKRISQSMLAMNTRKSNTTSYYIGCSIAYLKRWMEFLFTDKMNWQNYGDWHIDHVLPCSSFDLTKVEDQIECFNWKNLRPCLKEENLSKGDKIINSIVDYQKRKVSEFLKINPLPTYPGDRDKGAE